ncbi:pentatricopeptide repeat-containing protein [Senna tora]|uniref:Pentatricopeptide repeat-containing protein n=1 Tax=Senna tora TaxID=362788 RepID=A0A834W106_9FABA|nr:pentatricopeptide repeat-containing protein [Senna tora]
MFRIRSKLSVFSVVIPCIYQNLLPVNLSHIVEQTLTSAFNILNPSKSETLSAPPKLGFSVLLFSSSIPTTNFGASTDSPVLRLGEALGDDYEEEDCNKGNEKNDIHFDQLDIKDDLVQDIKTILDILDTPGCGPSEIKYKLEQCCIRASSELVVEILSRVRNDWQAAYTFFLWAGKQPGYSPSIREYHSMISILGKMRKFDIAWTLIEEMSGHNSGSSFVKPRTLLIMIRRYCAVHDVESALNTFYAYERYNFHVGLEEFQSLISALCEYKNVQDAEHLLFCSENLFPLNTRSFNIILGGWCYVNVNTSHAQRIWQEMSKRGIQYDVVSYACIISCYSKASKLSKVLKLFDHMQRMQITPNRKVYNAVIHTLAKHRLVKEAVNLMRIMEDNGIAPNLATFNSLIKALCQARLIEEAELVLDEMLQRGLSPTIQTYHALFRILRSKEEVYELWIKMRRLGCHPTIETYIMMIRRFCQWRQLHIVFSLWSEMSERGFKHEHCSYTALIHGLFLNGKLKDAYKYYQEMLEKGFRPEPRTEKMIQIWFPRIQVLENLMTGLSHDRLGHRKPYPVNFIKENTLLANFRPKD